MFVLRSMGRPYFVAVSQCEELSGAKPNNMAIQITATEPDSDRHPEKKLLCESKLHEGKKVTKTTKLWDICSPKTGHHKKYGLTITREHITESERTISLEDSEGENSIQALHEFLHGAEEIDTDGEYLVVDLKNNPLGQIVDLLPDSSLIADSFSSIVEILRNPSIIAEFAKLDSDELKAAQGFAAGINYLHMSHTLDEFERLVSDGCGKCTGCKKDNACIEQTYQDFLEKNHWMFGSEYSELMKNRELTKGKKVDFPLRRTVDGYLEIIEIKRPKIGTSNETTFSHN